jgi:hypothetical protein
MLRLYRDLLPCGCFSKSAAALFLILNACSSNVQPAVLQFGQATTTAVSAEGALFDAIDQRKSDAQDLCVLASKAINTDNNGRISPRDAECQSSDGRHGTKEIPADVRRAIDGVLGAIQAYGQALESLAADTAATTFNTNVNGLGRSIVSFDRSVLTPLGGSGLPTQTQLNSVGQAVKDVGDGLIAFAISRDVQSAAKKMQEPLHTIVGGLNNINGYWTARIPNILSNEISPYIIGLWAKGTLSDRQTLLADWKKASAPLTPDAADESLANLVTANDRIAAAGPTASVAEIKSAWQAANDAYAAYKALGR